MFLKGYDQLRQCTVLLLFSAKTERSVFSHGFSGCRAPKTIAYALRFLFPHPSAAMKLT